MFRKIIILISFVIATSVYSQTNSRGYISTRLAKSIISTGDIIPDDGVKEICDGSGWITHGDGHKTPCPGCAACQNDGEEPSSTKDGCKCGCGEVGCTCKDGSCKNVQTVQQAVPKADFSIYHMGATWCPPCLRMQSETWGNKDVKDFLKNNGISIHMMDHDDPKHKKFFKYYKATSLPTVLIINIETREAEKTIVGFTGPESMLLVLKDRLND